MKQDEKHCDCDNIILTLFRSFNIVKGAKWHNKGSLTFFIGSLSLFCNKDKNNQ